MAIPEDRSSRIRLALDAAHEALRLARREAEAAVDDRVRYRWAALGLVVALQGALVAALSGYETATREAVLNPAEQDRMAPLSLLLRRARSGEYLNAPERVELRGQSERALERVIAVRNGAVHALVAELPETIRADLLAAAGLIEHVVLEAPAFDPGPVRVLTVLIGDELKALRAALVKAPLD